MKHILIVEDRQDSMLHLSIILTFLGYSSSRVTVNSSEFFNSFSCELYACIIGEIKRKRLYSNIIKVLRENDNVPVIAYCSQKYFLNSLINLVGSLPKELSYKSVKDALECVEIFRKFKNLYSYRHGEIFETIRGRSSCIHELRKEIINVATTDTTIMILGNTGVGKEYIARTIHKLSHRRNGPFVALNCALISSDFFESELFCYDKENSNNSVDKKNENFESSNGGTLFLDEISELPLSLQLRLLMVLQEHCITNADDVNTNSLNFRLIVSTHRNLDDMIENNTFKNELLYRISGFPIVVPSLSDRVEDLAILIAQQLENVETCKRIKFSNTAIHSLMKYSWPGNLRELSNLINRLVILYPGETISFDKLPNKYKVGSTNTIEYGKASSELSKVNECILNPHVLISQSIVVDDMRHEYLCDFTSNEILNNIVYKRISLMDFLRRIEIDYIKMALVESDGIVTIAAKKLTMSRTTLVEKIKRFAL